MNTLFFLIACSTHYNVKGLLFQEKDKLYMGSFQGKTYRLHAGEDSAYLQYLEGCGATISGSRLGKHIWLSNWHITDAGDGSEPFIGTIVRQGLKLILRDINTKQELEILGADVLYQEEGKAVLITGIVVGTHQIQLIEYRVLE